MKSMFFKRMLLISMCLFVSACASSTDTLISEAYLTGDWKAVDQRFAAEEKRRQASINYCGDREILICTTELGSSDCSCVSTAVVERSMRRLFGGPERGGPDRSRRNIEYH